ncbi:hypothetical protein H0H93_006156 [Arthromyces matolae]|nr:hypothetical protein H0H93_006156 [Arthromyces matolae]
MNSKVHTTILLAVLIILPLSPAKVDAVPLPVLCTPITVNNDDLTLLLPSKGNVAAPFTILSGTAAHLPVRSIATANNTELKSSIGGNPIRDSESDVSPSNNESLSRNVIASMVAFLREQTIQDSFELSSEDVITPPPTAHIRTSNVLDSVRDSADIGNGSRMENL